MKLKALTSALAIGLFASSNASAIVVGGVDFGVLGETSHIDTATFANTWIAPGSAAGTTATGYGLVATINGSSNYCGADCALFFTYSTELAVAAPVGPGSSLQFTNSVYTFYLSNAPINLLLQSSAANLAFITSQTPWAQFTGHQIGGVDYTISAVTYTGTSFFGFGSGYANVNTGFGLPGVGDFLNGNGEEFGTDLTIGSSTNSSVLNTFDTCGFVNGEYCLQGSADIRGDTNLVVPEPASLALLGIGALGLGLSLRRKAA